VSSLSRIRWMFWACGALARSRGFYNGLTTENLDSMAIPCNSGPPGAMEAIRMNRSRLDGIQ
jgi:hypothetical protein